MQCNSCGSKWESKNIVTTCPFCGKTLLETSKDESIEIVLKHIVETQGIEIYDRPSALIGIISDVLPKAADERRLIKLCAETGAIKELLKIIKMDEIEASILQKKVSKELQEHCFINEIMAEKFVYWILFSLGEADLIYECDSNYKDDGFQSKPMKIDDYSEDEIKTLKKSLNDLSQITNCIERKLNIFLNTNQFKEIKLSNDSINCVGKRLDGRYEIEKIISLERFSVVYKAYDNVDKRTVVINVLDDRLNEQALRTFKIESKALVMLSHPNIIELLDICFGDMLKYIVSEYVEGITLKEFLKVDKNLSCAETLYLIEQILEGLHYAHEKGITHDAVCPDNILLEQNTNIKIINFALARACSVIDRAINPYIELNEDMISSPQTDVYCVGCLLSDMLLSNSNIFNSEVEKIPKGLKQIIKKATEKDTLKRYATAKEMLTDILKFKNNPEIVFDHDCINNVVNTNVMANAYIMEKTVTRMEEK